MSLIKQKQECNRELAGYMKTSNGDLVPVYTTDKVWLELKAKLIKKIEEIEKGFKKEEKDE